MSDLLAAIHALRERLDDIPQADERRLQDLKTEILGRKAGALTKILAALPDLDPAGRKTVGGAANALKRDFEARFAERERALTVAARAPAGADLTMPGRATWRGGLHLVTQVTDEICEIFRELGFTRAVGPEAETEWYNFGALNFPKDHPAIDAQDSFYLGDGLLLRTHTSPVQVRTMERYPPPIRVVSPGQCYRRDPFDPSHSPVFEQIEGLVVDEGVSFVDLKATLSAFARRFFGPQTATRFSPSYFPFTEPSADMQVSCSVCRGKGCPTCKQTGWLEILGAGMVHPAVFEHCRIDSERYTGFAFGMGPHRIAMVRHGIPDIRLFFESDVRFLEQFTEGGGLAMILSCRWLEALLERSLDPHDLDQRLNMLGTPVEAIVPLHQDLRDVLVAQVLEVKKHPNADRLSLCTVDAGAGLVEVVCGAPNVRAQKKYPYAAVGTVLPGGLKLERKKIRGVESNGMLCSARELGLGQESDGILELDTDAAPGSRFLDAMPIADYQIVLEVTANRPDLLCHRGVARELGAVYGVPVKLPVIPGGQNSGGQNSGGRKGGGQAVKTAVSSSAASPTAGVVDGVEIRLEDAEGCPRYMAAVIRGVTVGNSPAWLATRLASVGQRPINNVVDATNYVLFELNQPLHAFDLAKLRGPAVVIRRARAGERIVTLDGVERQMSPEMTAICDAERPTIVAGVMGSADSEVSEATTDIVLECAYFQPTRIRRTRRALGLSSESSYRFERGIDMLAMPDALRRAVELITATAGGEMREPPLDLWPEPVHEQTIFLRPERVGRLLGMAIEAREIEARLSSIGFFVAPKDGRLAVQVPGWRPDVTREVDLIEEVARLKGYDAFPDELRPYCPGTVPDAPLERAKARVREGLAAAGLYEARTFPLGPAEGPGAVQVLNPMSAEEGFLRTRLLPGLVRRVERNWGARSRDVRLFEVGTVFERGKGEGGKAKGVEEWTSVAAVLTGSRRPAHWTDGAKVPDMDLWDLKYHFELAVRLAAPSAGVQVVATGTGWEAREPGGTVIGWAGPLEGDAPVWAAPLYGLELRLEVVERKPAPYRALPVAPPVESDLALVLPPGVTALAVAEVLRRQAGPLLERLTVFDEYRGAGIPADHRSVAWHCSFRDPVRTLRENEVEKILTKALQALEDELGVRRRTG